MPSKPRRKAGLFLWAKICAGSPGSAVRLSLREYASSYRQPGADRKEAETPPFGFCGAGEGVSFSASRGIGSGVHWRGPRMTTVAHSSPCPASTPYRNEAGCALSRGAPCLVATAMPSRISPLAQIVVQAAITLSPNDAGAGDKRSFPVLGNRDRRKLPRPPRYDPACATVPRKPCCRRARRNERSRHGRYPRGA